MLSMKSILRAAFILILSNFLNVSGWCQLPVITFEVITSRDGLPSNTVLSATRDYSGFMWFGTRLCPVRYDGVAFKSFAEYTTNFVTGICPDSANNMWLSSDRSGISMIDVNRMQMIRIPRDQEDEARSTGKLYIDKRGEGWYSDYYGVNHINLVTRKHKHYPLPQTNFVWLKASFVEDADNNLWVIGRDNGLFQYDRQRDTLICVLNPDSAHSNNPDPLIMSTGTMGKDGFIWIGTYNYGLMKFDPRTQTVEYTESGLPDGQILAVEEGLDENGRRILWIGGSHGLGIFRPEQEKFYFFPDILPNPYEVNDIYRDPDGIVWVCTSDGIIKYHPRSNAIQVIPVPKEVLSQPFNVNVIYQDKRTAHENIFYLGLSTGVLLRWDRNTNQFAKIPFPSAVAETRWIHQDEEGMLWVGTNRWDYKRPGIFVYDPKAEKFFTSPLVSLANGYFSVPFFMYGCFDGDRFFIGNSDEGIHVFDRKSLTESTPWSETVMKTLIKNNNLINDMIVSKDGRLWLGTYNGVYHYDEKNQQFLRADPAVFPAGVDDTAVNSLLEDRNGNVWAARWGSLTMMSELGKIEKVVSVKDGFDDREIKGLAEGRSGDIWAGNHEGLYCFSPTTNRLIKFTMNDGLISNRVDRIFKTRNDSELLIGQSGAFNLVKLDEILKRVDPPPVVVTSFKVHQTEYSAAQNELIRLKPSENVFSVDFVALNYRKVDDNQYAYYLEGFEEDWNYIGSKHVAYYTNLNPGDYTLHMRSGDALGNWNEDTLKMKIVVLPAFYQTLWFKILISLAVAGILYAFYRYRINQLLHLQQVRNRISADLHDELGSTLSGISIMGSLAKKELSNQPGSSLLVDRIMEDVRQISGSLDDIVWNISPKNDSLSSVIARMTRYASELFEAKQIAFRLDIPEALEDLKLSMEQRRNIYLIFKESVNNLAKYSRCTEALVKIRVEKRKVFLIVKDNGVGFNPEAITDRNGIRNMKYRAHSLKGAVDIQSAKGSGTSIILQFPLPV